MNTSNSTPIVIPMEDPIVHTQNHPFCSDTTCPCHADPELTGTLEQEWLDGLRSTGETFAVYWNQGQA